MALIAVEVILHSLEDWDLFTSKVDYNNGLIIAIKRKIQRNEWNRFDLALLFGLDKFFNENPYLANNTNILQASLFCMCQGMFL